MTESQSNCLSVLAVWLLAISLLADVVAPGLSRITYPQWPDLLVLTLIPLGAYHAARYGRHRLPFLIYGCLTSTTAFAYHYTLGQGRIGLKLMYYPGEEIRLALVACAVTVGFGFLCRAVPGIRTRREARKSLSDPSCQKCGYNLTGNVSGTCPECGTAVPG